MKKIELSVYLANLKKYNENKKDYGTWVDFTQDREDVKEQVELIIKYDDYAIHDSETNLAIDIKENTSIETLLDLIEVLEVTEYPLSVINNILSQHFYIEDAIEVLENESFDCYDDIENKKDLGYILAEFLELPEIGRRYFNYENYGRDAVFEGWHIDCGAAVYIY